MFKIGDLVEATIYNGRGENCGTVTGKIVDIVTKDLRFLKIKMESGNGPFYIKNKKLNLLSTVDKITMVNFEND